MLKWGLAFNKASLELPQFTLRYRHPTERHDDLNLISIGTKERYEIPALFGGSTANFAAAISGNVRRDVAVVEDTHPSIWLVCRLFALALRPELSGDRQRIQVSLLPPLLLVSRRVVLLVMNCAERHGELVADFESNSLWLSEANMMGMGRCPPTDQAWLQGHEFQVLFRPDPFHLSEGERALVDFGA